MGALSSTKSFTAAEVFDTVDGFADAVKNFTVAWQIEPGGRSFGAAIRKRSFGDYLFGEVQYGPCSGTRGADDISRSGERYICLSVYNQGRLSFTQQGRTIEINPSDLVLWDASIPADFDCHAHTQCDLLWIPARLVERRMGQIGHFLSQKASSHTGATRILASHVQSLHESITDVPDALRQHILNASVELIFSCFDPLQCEDSSSNRTRELLARAQKEIAHRIETGDVRPDDIAKSLGIGVRYLHKIFSTSGMTFSACVTQERLERARFVLLDPRQISTTMTEIAHWFGFCDLSHFNRSFKQRYGLTPAAYRALQTA